MILEAKQPQPPPKVTATLLRWDSKEGDLACKGCGTPWKGHSGGWRILPEVIYCGACVKERGE